MSRAAVSIALAACLAAAGCAGARPPGGPAASPTPAVPPDAEPATEEERLAQAYDLFFEARRCARERRWEEAVRLVDRALERRFEFQDFHFAAAAFRIDLYRATGFAEPGLALRAVQHFEWIMDRVPGSPYAERSCLGLGFAHQSLAWAEKDAALREKRVAEAFRQYRRAGEADPRSPEPFLALAEAYAELGYDLKAATDYVAEAARRGPADEARVKAAMGLILMKRGSWADAASAFRDAADKDRANPWHWYQAAFCSLKRAGQVEAAAAPADAGAAARAAGLRRAAESYLRRALGQDPQCLFLTGLEVRGRVDAAFAARARAAAEEKEKGEGAKGLGCRAGGWAAAGSPA